MDALNYSQENTKMEIDCSDNSNWLLDYGIVEAIPLNWPLQSPDFNSACSITSMSVEDLEGLMEEVSRKRLRSTTSTCTTPDSKACREKQRRDKLKDRFLELGSILEPGKPPKTDKATILGEAIRVVSQLQTDTEDLKKSNELLQERIKELKAEKNELREEKQRLKSEKETLELQMKAKNAQPGFLTHPPTMPAMFASQAQAAGNKLMPFVGYPSVAMWQYMQPAVVDTSQDHILRPPVA
jgi:FtsZ-binding cell division protein ZapB